MEAVAFILLAILIEAIVEILKSLISEGKLNKSVALSLLVAIPVTVLTGLDLFELAGLPIAVPYVGAALSGIIISRGSNYVSDLVSKFNQ